VPSFVPSFLELSFVVARSSAVLSFVAELSFVVALNPVVLSFVEVLSLVLTPGMSSTKAR